MDCPGRIMEEVGNESVLSALEAIISEYGEGIADIAVTIIAQLVRCFETYSSETEDEEATYSAVQVWRLSRGGGFFVVFT